MLVHQLAARSGLPPDTIRHYVRIGLLQPARAANGYAVFGDDAVVVAELIQIGKTLGFTLSELKRQLRPFHGGELSYEDVRQVLIDKEAEVSRRIDALTGIRDRLRSMLTQCPLQAPLAGTDKRPA